MRLLFLLLISSAMSGQIAQREPFKIELRLPEQPRKFMPKAEFRFYRSNMVNIRAGRMKFSVHSTADGQALIGALSKFNDNGADDFMHGSLTNSVKYNVRARYKITSRIKIYTGIQGVAGKPLPYFGIQRKF